MNIHITYQEERFKHCFDQNRLQDKVRWAERDIERLKDTIEKLEAHKEAIHDQMELVNQTAFNSYVELCRREYDKITYYVKLVHHPAIERQRIGGEFVYGTFEHHESFEGRERNKAIEYAKKLATLHHCKIKLQGLKPPKQLLNYISE